jgi:hypothetical protein
MKKFNLGTIVALTLLATACGKQSSTYSSKAKAAAGAAATSPTATSIEGQWQQCTNGVMAVYTFSGNGYSIYNDYYSSSDCSDSNWNTENGIDSGTFQLGAAPQANSGTTTSITFTPASYTGNSSYTGSVINMGTSIGLYIGSNPMLMLRNVTAGSGNIATTGD